MTTDTPYIGFGTDDNGAKMGVIGAETYSSVAAMLSARATLANEPVPLAGALNHFDENGNDFDVITDPAAYKTDFLQRYAAEEEMDWDQFTARLTDFELPDFEQLTPPTLSGGQISFCANHLGLDSPYRVTGLADGSAPLTYEPI